MAAEASGLSRPLALHVSGLAATTQELELYQFFSDISVQVSSLRIVRGDNQEARYAYVNFLSTEDAEKALNSLNYKKLHDKEIILSRSIPASQRKPEANLFVSALPTPCRSEDLYNAFSPYGQIVCARVSANHPYGYVQFDCVEAANKAIEATAKEIPIANQTHQLKTEVFKPYDQRQRVNTNVFIRNYPVAGGEEGFKAFVESFGKVTSVFFKTDVTELDGKTPSKTGFGFANYETAEQAEKALQEIPLKEVEGFKVEAFIPKTKSARSTEIYNRSKQWSPQLSNIYVKHVPSVQPLEEVEAFFRQFGVVSSFKVNMTQAGQRTGVMFVQYATPDEAHKAIIAARHRGYYSAIHQPKPLRVQQLQKQWAEQQHQRQPIYPYPPRPYRRNNNNNYQGQGQGQRRQPRQHNQQHGMQPSQPQQMGGQQQQRRQPRKHNNQQQQQVQQQQGGQRRQQRKHPQQQQQQQAADPEAQRRQLGEELFWKVQAHDDAQAPKITGMLLEMQPEEVRKLLQDESMLKEKVQEAQTILAQQAPTAQ